MSTSPMNSDPTMLPVKEPAPSPARSRRALLAATAGAAGAVVAQAVGGPLSASAASVRLGAVNSSTNPTEFDDTRHSSSAIALIGRTTYTTNGGGGAGVQGVSKGTDGTGVWGVANKGSDAYGVFGSSSQGMGVVGSGPTGVYGYGLEGVEGLSDVDQGTGVYGVASGSFPSWGVYGFSSEGPGVSGASGTGESFGWLGAPDDTGIYAYTDGNTGIQVYNEAGHTGWAGYFEGDVYIDTLYTATSFAQVDHPASPGERWYRTANVGSFEQIDVISGNARTDAGGRVTVRVPADFARYHEDFRYQLTPMGAAGVPFVARRMSGDRFVIGSEHGALAVSWQLTGRRTDPAAKAARFEVDARKTGAERGRFLQPALYGKSAKRGIRRPLAGKGRPSSRHAAVKDLREE